jgi:RHS repeat-associated protein
MNGGEYQHSYIYGLDAALELRQYLNGVGSILTQQMYLVHDGHGSVRAVTDQNGAVTDTYDYDAFGVLIHQTGTTPNTTLYSGEQFDSDLGMYFLRARYINPATGRFWTMDTFEGDSESPESLHKYLYVESDPTNNVDPSGHGIDDVLVTAALYVGIGAAVGGGLGYYVTGTTKGAGFGALGGGLVGLTLAFGSLKQKIDVVVAGAANASFQTLANYLTEYYDQAQNIPPPSRQTENELVVEAFTAGSVNALIGTTLGLSGGGGSALSSIGNSLITAEFQGKSLKSALPSAIVGALTGYTGSFVEFPGGNIDLYAVGKIVTTSVSKTISTAGTPVFKATIQALDPNLYNFLYGE